MLMLRYKRQEKHSTKTADATFGEVAKFKYLGTTLTDQNCMHEKVKTD
jgi:hypothetical protein